MDALYLACVLIAGSALVLISAVIPWAVFTRYVLNSAASWPEPTAILLMIVLTFIGSAACYRRRLHMNVSFFVLMLPATLRIVAESLAELLVAAMAVFMVIYGGKLVEVTWYNTIPDFPSLSVGVTYLPIPLGGALLLLFVIERAILGMPAESQTPTSRNRRLGGGRQSDGCRHPPDNDVRLFRHRRANRLFAGARRDCRGAVDRHSAGSGNAQNLRRRQQGRHADHSVFRIGRRNHGRRRHGAPPRCLRRCPGRLHPRARRPFGGQCAGDDFSERHFRLSSGGHFRHRFGDDPADGEERVPSRIRYQCDDHRLGAGSPRAAEPQCGDLFARHRRHHLDHQPVHGRRRARPAARLLADRAVPRHRLSRRASARTDRPAARSDQDLDRRAVGTDYAR